MGISDVAATIVVGVLVCVALYVGWMIDRWTQRLGERIYEWCKGLSQKMKAVF